MSTLKKCLFKYDAFTSTNFIFQREEPMVMFANDRLYSFAKVVEHEDNKVFQTNDKTVVYIRTILKK